MAKGITSAEVVKFVMQLDNIISTHPAAQALLKGEQPYYVMDLPKVHLGAKKQLMKMGIKFWPQPRYAPDFNKPIEHVFGWMSRAFKKWVTGIKEKISPGRAWKKLQQIFYSASPKGLDKDVLSLPRTWRHVATPRAKGGSGGDWPADPKLR